MLFGKLFTNPKMWVTGDADEIKMGGVYTCKDVQNVPTGDGALFVFKTEDTVKQVFIPVGVEGVLYTRTLGGEWTAVSVGEISDSIEEVADDLDEYIASNDTALDAVRGIAQSAAGNTPTVVTTVAEMTDEDAIYVYAGSEENYTAGNWYYYNGTAWTSGGVYGARIDNTLTKEGWAADAKKTGDDIAALKADLTNVETKYLCLNHEDVVTKIPANSDLDDYTTVGSYKITTLASARTISNTPVISWLNDVRAGKLIVFKTTDYYQIRQAYIANTTPVIITIRSKSTADDSWSVWREINPLRDSEPTADSNNLILSKAVYNAIENVKSDSIKSEANYCNALGTALTYRIPKKAPVGTSYIKDSIVVDGVEAELTQGICTDGRFLYYNLGYHGSTSGHGNPQTIRKWDTWTNKLVASSTPGDYGHCEDLCFVPSWAKGFDNGTVDRIYATDLNYSNTYATGYYIHVFNAETLEYITSFETVSLIDSDYWNGAARITFNQERGLFFLNQNKTIDDVKYFCMGVFDYEGNLVKHGYAVWSTGTWCGADSDENYIYVNRYVEQSGVVNYYTYVIDWNLTPIARFQVDEFDWEWECGCHIGSDVYYAWNQAASGRTGNNIEKTSMIYEYHKSTDTTPFNWPTADSLKYNQWTIVI